MRSIWTGSIGFGLVNIPIKLYSAVQESRLNLDMLDKKDNSNIKFQRINETTGKVVSWENIVKGYNVDGKYVIITDEDFEKAMPEKTKVIEIDSFADQQEIDSMLFDTPYYIEPDKSGGKAYTLLFEALKKTGKVGLGSFVLRNKENLCLIKPAEKILIVQKIKYQQEIRSTEDFKIPEIKVKPQEVKMAVSLIDQLTQKFDISKYKDSYNEKLMKLIEAKSKGKKIDTPKMRVVHTKTADLMAQLKASLDTGKKQRKAS